MNRAPLVTITFGDPPRAPVVRPAPSTVAIQDERLRLAALKRARKADKLKREMRHG